MVLDLKIFNELGEFIFTPTSPFSFNNETILDKYRIILTSKMSDILSKKNTNKADMTIASKKAISETNKSCRNFKGFLTSSLKKLDIDQEKGYMEFVVDVRIGSESLEVKIV